MIRVGLIYPEQSVIKETNYVWLPSVPRVGDEIIDQYGRLTVEKVVWDSIEDADGEPAYNNRDLEVYCHMKFEDSSVWGQH